MKPLLRCLPYLLILLAIVPFLPALDAGFLNWDDDHNFVWNEHYRGLAWENLQWMFTTSHHGGYYPLAWVTFGIDHALWGMNPRGYHLTNLVLHVLGVLLLFLLVRKVLLRLDGQAGRAATWAALLAALLFACHPLRVESVAWVTERRGLLASVLWLGSLLAYLAAWAPERTSARRRTWLAVSVLLFVLSLFSKVIGITLPAVLLVLDLEVLRRKGFWKLVLEKWPYFAAGVLIGLLARSAQVEGEVARSFAEHTLGGRSLQAAYGLAFYLWKTAVPVGLSPIYPLDHPIELGQPYYLPAALALLGALGVIALLILGRRRWHGLLAATAAYVAILLPVLGFMQSGPQIAADRYTYLASVPLVVLAAYGLLRVLRGRWAGPAALAVGLVIVALGLATQRQTAIWKDSVSLWERAVELEPGSVIAHLQYAQALDTAGRLPESAEHYAACTRLRPDHALAWYDLGLALYKTGRHAEAADAWRHRLALPPPDPRVLYCMAIAAEGLGDGDEALTWCQRAVQAAPGYAAPWLLMAQIHQRRGDSVQARTMAERALALDPGFELARMFLRSLDR